MVRRAAARMDAVAPGERTYARPSRRSGDRSDVVLPGRRREGIGSQMLRAFCVRMDELGEVAFLETDKLDSVRFYARCGFKVREQAEVLGTPNWWMRRPARNHPHPPKPRPSR